MGMRIRKIALTIAVVVFSQGTALAQKIQINTLGARPCATWLDDRKTPAVSLSNEAWVIGFLNGIVAVTSKNILTNVNANAIGKWVDNYCRNNPLDDTFDAGYALADELKKRTRN